MACRRRRRIRTACRRPAAGACGSHVDRGHRYTRRETGRTDMHATDRVVAWAGHLGCARGRERGVTASAKRASGSDRHRIAELETQLDLARSRIHALESDLDVALNDLSAQTNSLSWKL